MPVKVYALLDVLDSSAPIYQHLPGNQRVKMVKMPVWEPFLRITTSVGGKSRTIRYKETATSIYEDEQIEKNKIPIDAPFTQRERGKLKFRRGVIALTEDMAQEYIENYPAFDGFKGVRPEECPRALYTLIDETKQKDLRNEEIKLRVKSTMKVMDMELPEAQAMYIKITGSYEGVPSEEKECQNRLAELINDMEHDQLVDFAELALSKDDEADILIGKLVNHGILSFTEVENAISRNDITGKWTSVKQIPSSYPPEERRRYFIMYLTSPDGELLLASLKKALAKIEKTGEFVLDNKTGVGQDEDQDQE